MGNEFETNKAAIIATIEGLKIPKSVKTEAVGYLSSLKEGGDVTLKRPEISSICFWSTTPQGSHFWGRLSDVSEEGMDWNEEWGSLDEGKQAVTPIPLTEGFYCKEGKEMWVSDSSEDDWFKTMVFGFIPNRDTIYNVLGVGDNYKYCAEIAPEPPTKEEIVESLKGIAILVDTDGQWKHVSEYFDMPWSVYPDRNNYTSIHHRGGQLWRNMVSECEITYAEFCAKTGETAVVELPKPLWGVEECQSYLSSGKPFMIGLAEKYNLNITVIEGNITLDGSRLEDFKVLNSKGEQVEPRGELS